MLTFLLLFFQRILSGAVNGSGYGKRGDLVFFFSAMHLGITAACCVLMPNWYMRAVMLLPLFAVHLKAAVFLNFKFKWKTFNDIHLLETVIVSVPILLVCLSGNSIFLAAMSVYPSLLLHKGLVNIGGGTTFWNEATDDATGNTWGLPSIGLKIPRTGNIFRISMAVASVIGAALYLIFKPEFSVNIFNILFKF